MASLARCSRSSASTSRHRLASCRLPKWGTETHIGELFGDAAAKIDAVERTFLFRYRSAAHFVDVFRSWYGPIHKAFAALGDAGGPALEADLIDLVGRFDQSGTERMLVPGTYLQSVITRR